MFWKQFPVLITGCIIPRSLLWKVHDSVTKTVDIPNIILASFDSSIYVNISFYVICPIPREFKI